MRNGVSEGEWKISKNSTRLWLKQHWVKYEKKPTAQEPVHNLPSLDRDRIGGIENRLLPVRILGVRPRRKPHGLVACRESNVKPPNEGVNVVITRGSQGEGGAEGEIGLGNCFEVNFL
ncbi:hypothetical protein BC937DRAFT_94061 [Endogone sp. FLAS-F59071]|nr:hypothetical protein BC937DRAFT_94061 [Endogone sp. FLAS-F59071]|eukprot:RUS14280.1 hypothetical protein BC937DRAFT_94061 [Endogone sp. FLAS-F59071]